MFHLQGEFKVSEKDFTMKDVIRAAEENRVLDRLAFSTLYRTVS